MTTRFMDHMDDGSPILAGLLRPETTGVVLTEEALAAFVARDPVRQRAREAEAKVARLEDLLRTARAERDTLARAVAVLESEGAKVLEGWCAPGPRSFEAFARALERGRAALASAGSHQRSELECTRCTGFDAAGRAAEAAGKVH